MNEKKALKQKDVITTIVPKYEELSVKNLYQDALKEEILKDYLPDLHMNSNRLPERNFFFGILSTIKNDYVNHIIEEANMNRYNSIEAEGREDYIAIQENWYQELIKHPFISKKPGKAIFLIKQRSKLFRNKKIQHKFDVSQRLNTGYEEEKSILQNYEKTQKRQKRKQSDYTTINQSQETMSLQHFNI